MYIFNNFFLKEYRFLSCLKYPNNTILHIKQETIFLICFKTSFWKRKFFLNGKAFAVWRRNNLSILDDRIYYIHLIILSLKNIVFFFTWLVISVKLNCSVRLYMSKKTLYSKNKCFHKKSILGQQNFLYFFHGEKNKLQYFW